MPIKLFCEIKQNDSKIDLEKSKEPRVEKRRQERGKKRMRRINMKIEGRNIKVGNPLPDTKTL